MVLAAVRESGTALLYARPQFKNDLRIVLEAVKSYHRCLSIASPFMRKVFIDIFNQKKENKKN